MRTQEEFALALDALIGEFAGDLGPATIGEALELKMMAIEDEDWGEAAADGDNRSSDDERHQDQERPAEDPETGPGQ